MNFAENPEAEFQGFYTATSTYGAFVYLHYGLMRLYSQLAQDNQLKVGKVLWIAGHSGPETADDSRTHFGISRQASRSCSRTATSSTCTLGAQRGAGVARRGARAEGADHRAAPDPAAGRGADRAALGMPSHFAAASGAYVMREYRANQQPRAP